jgi:hypothetical protein
VAFDAEVTTSRPGAALLVLAGFVIAAAAVGVAGVLFHLVRRTTPGRLIFGGRTTGITFACGAAALFYGGYYLNAGVLPGKTHPLSLGADVALLLLFWLAVRFIPGFRTRRRVLFPTLIILTVAAVVTAAAVAGSSRRLGPPEAAAPPGAANLLIITMDTTRADRLGAYGGPPGLTPNLDKLTASAQVYPRAYCAMPLTGPSHASLFTGRTPRDLGIVQNGMRLVADTPTMAEVLRSRGYRTGAVVAAFTVSSKLGFDRGFEYFDDAFSPAAALTRLTTARIAGATGLVAAKAGLQRPGGEVTPRAIRWLEDEAHRPFFLWVHYFDPHTPYEPPAAYRGRTSPADPNVGLYDGEVAFMDAEVGKLLAALDDLGVRDETVVVAVADHGESLGEHDYYYDHGRDVYEPCMHVPLIVAAPAGFPGMGVEFVMTPPNGGADPVAMSSLFDFLLEGLAAFPPKNAPSSNEIVPLASDEVFGESLEEEFNYRMIVTREGGLLYKLLLDAVSGRVELYDLDADPNEVRDLAAARADVVRALRPRLEEYFRQQPALPVGGPADEDTKEKLRSLGYM